MSEHAVRARSRRAGREGGFSLVEVMVALVILAVGLLALASLQTRALSGGASSYQRTQAALAAYDIIDRIRANRNATTLAATFNYNIAFGAVPPAADTIARRDLLQWKGRECWAGGDPTVAIAPPEGLGAIPLGDGSVAVDNAGNVTVTVRWDDNRDGDNTDADEQIRMDSRL